MYNKSRPGLTNPWSTCVSVKFELHANNMIKCTKYSFYIESCTVNLCSFDILGTYYDKLSLFTERLLDSMFKNLSAKHTWQASTLWSRTAKDYFIEVVKSKNVLH